MDNIYGGRGLESRCLKKPSQFNSFCWYEGACGLCDAGLIHTTAKSHNGICVPLMATPQTDLFILAIFDVIYFRRCDKMCVMLFEYKMLWDLQDWTGEVPFYSMIKYYTTINYYDVVMSTHFCTRIRTYDKNQRTKYRLFVIIIWDIIEILLDLE